VAVAVGVGLGVPTGTKVHPPLAGPSTLTAFDSVIPQPRK